MPVQHYAEATWDSVMDINVKGVFLSMKYELPHVLARKGAIVNMASVAGLKGSRMGAAYVASKHAVVGLTRAMALEFAALGIRVNAVCPGLIRTRLTQHCFDDPKFVKPYFQNIPLGRGGEAEEVANAIVFLASDAASFITGAHLIVDGGQMAAKFGVWNEEMGRFDGQRWVRKAE